MAWDLTNRNAIKRRDLLTLMGYFLFASMDLFIANFAKELFVVNAKYLSGILFAIFASFHFRIEFRFLYYFICDIVLKGILSWTFDAILMTTKADLRKLFGKIYCV